MLRFKHFLLLLLITACSDFPSDFIAPEITLNANIPLIDTLETIDKAIGDDTAYFKKTQDGNIYLKRTETIYETKYGDAIKMPVLDFYYESDINSQKEFLNNLNFKDSSIITINNLFTGYNLPPSPANLPSISTNVSTPANLPSNIEYVIFKDGYFNLAVENRTPISLNLLKPKPNLNKGFLYIARNNSSFLFETNDEQSVFPPFSHRGRVSDTGGALIKNLSGLRIDSGGKIDFSISTQATSSPVAYNANSGIYLNYSCTNPQIESAKLSLESKKFVFNIEIPFKENISLSEGEIENFIIKGNINNQFPISGRAKITFTQLTYSTDGKQFTHEFDVMSDNAFQPFEFKNFGKSLILKPDSLDMTINNGNIKSIRAKLEIQSNAIPINDKQIFSTNDRFIVKGQIENATFIRAKGNSAPSMEIKVSSNVKVNTDEIADKFTFLNINAGILNAKFFISNTAEVDGEIDGMAYITAKSGRVIDSIEIPKQTVKGKSETEIFVSKQNLNLNELPDSIKTTATIRTLPNRVFSAHKNDFINGRVELSFPLKLKLESGKLKDTVRVNFSKDEIDNKDYFISGELRTEFLNKIPAKTSFKVVFVDSNYSSLLEIPKNAPFTLNSPKIDDNGYTIDFAKSFNSIMLDSNDIDLIFKAKYLIINFELSTADQTKESSFRLDDYIHIKSELKLKAKTEN